MPPFEFSLQFSRHNGHVVVAVDGELDSYTGPLLQDRLADLIESQGNLSVVVDLSSMTFVDSSGLTALVAAHRWLQSRGGELILSRPTKSTMKVLEITGLNRVLAITQM